MIENAGSHRRRNLLTGEWVLVSPHRTQRPWQGRTEELPANDNGSYDPDCYLCPGNARAGGKTNPRYTGPWAFDNDFPALSEPGHTIAPEHSLLQSQAESGRCRVVCFSEQHDRHWTAMSLDEIEGVLRLFSAEFDSLDRETGISYVQAFENRGEMMGCSNSHPHAQIWATSTVPNEPAKEVQQQQRYWQENGRSLLLDYLATEEDSGTRILFANDQAVSLVPYWAVWPFETLLLPREPCGTFHDMSDDALKGFADVLKQTIGAYDGLFNVPMPYSMGFHPRPSDGRDYFGWQFHAHCYPPLLRSATVRKHMVGFEMLGMPQRDITPEVAAERLRLAAADEE